MDFGLQQVAGRKSLICKNIIILALCQSQKKREDAKGTGRHRQGFPPAGAESEDPGSEVETQ